MEDLHSISVIFLKCLAEITSEAMWYRVILSGSCILIQSLYYTNSDLFIYSFYEAKGNLLRT